MAGVYFFCACHQNSRAKSEGILKKWNDREKGWIVRTPSVPDWNRDGNLTLPYLNPLLLIVKGAQSIVPFPRWSNVEVSETSNKIEHTIQTAQ